MIHLVCGPPCAGKSTWVRNRATPGNTVIDFDDIAVELGSPTPWMHPQAYLDAAEREMRARLDTLTASPPDGDAYVIRSLADRTERQRWATRLGATVTLLDPGINVCLARARRDARPSGTTKAIRIWYWAAKR